MLHELASLWLEKAHVLKGILSKRLSVMAHDFIFSPPWRWRSILWIVLLVIYYIDLLFYLNLSNVYDRLINVWRKISKMILKCTGRKSSRANVRPKDKYFIFCYNYILNRVIIICFFETVVFHLTKRTLYRKTLNKETNEKI